MNKSTKAILIGVCYFVGTAAALFVLRSVIRSIPLADTVKDVTNWLLAALSGVSGGYSYWKKSDAKK